MEEKFDTQALRKASAVGAIQVTIPTKVAFDIETFFDMQRSIFERLGHPACYSGADIRFMLEREFVVDNNLNVRG